MIAPAIFKPRHISSVRKVKLALLGGPTEIPHGRTFYRGTGKSYPGGPNRLPEDNVIVPGISKGKRPVWMADTAKEASWYGPNIEKVIAKPGAKILDEGTKEFGKVIGLKGYDPKRRIGLQVGTADKTMSRMLKAAYDQGYDAVRFEGADVGTVIFNEGVFTRHAEKIVGKSTPADGPKTWRKLQGFFMHHILQKSADVDGNIVGKRILNNISGKPNSFGMPMMKEVFSEQQIKTLQTFGKAVKLTQERQAEGAGRVLIQLTQAGALGAILTGNLALPAATIIIAPAVMAKMMLNPRMAKLLTVGLTLPAKSPEAMGIMTRLTAAAIRINQGEENETTE
jgi:hypothetical protein